MRTDWVLGWLAGSPDQELDESYMHIGGSETGQNLLEGCDATEPSQSVEISGSAKFSVNHKRGGAQV